MKVLVTGGAGFIGSNFCRNFLNGSYVSVHEIVVLDALTYAGSLSNIQSCLQDKRFIFIEGDIRDSIKVEELVRECDAVVNFAAESHVDRSILKASEFVSTNIGGVQVLLDAINKIDKKVRFLQVSTDEVYGSIIKGSWKEEWPISPNSPYSATKAAAELLVQAYQKTHNLDVVVTRCSNNYGTYHFPEKLIPLFITNILEGKKVPLYGEGKNVRDWLHVDDHCNGIYKVLMNGKKGDIYNIGGGRELSNLEITHMILSEMGADESSIKFVEDRKGHDFRYSVDWSKIKNDLDYEPKVNFEEGLRETIKWYRNNISWWKPLKERAGL